MLRSSVIGAVQCSSTVRPKSTTSLHRLVSDPSIIWKLAVSKYGLAVALQLTASFERLSIFWREVKIKKGANLLSRCLKFRLYLFPIAVYIPKSCIIEVRNATTTHSNLLVFVCADHLSPQMFAVYVVNLIASLVKISYLWIFYNSRLCGEYLSLSAWANHNSINYSVVTTYTPIYYSSTAFIKKY